MLTEREVIISCFPALAEIFEEKYKNFHEGMGWNTDRKLNVSFECGSNYARIVKDDGQRSCLGFVALKDVTTKHGSCKAGDLLKCATWKAPALNFSRGSIFDLPHAEGKGYIRWTGLA